MLNCARRGLPSSEVRQIWSFSNSAEGGAVHPGPRAFPGAQRSGELTAAWEEPEQTCSPLAAGGSGNRRSIQPRDEEKITQETKVIHTGSSQGEEKLRIRLGLPGKQDTAEGPNHGFQPREGVFLLALLSIPNHQLLLCLGALGAVYVQHHLADHFCHGGVHCLCLHPHPRPPGVGIFLQNMRLSQYPC